MDHAATTAVDPRVIRAMDPFFSKNYGNASSLHTIGQEAKKALVNSRSTVASFLGVDPTEIIFTSSGTESNNMVLKGVAFANRNSGKHIITSGIEHHCILYTAKWLEDQGFEVTYLPVDRYGFVDPAELDNAIRSDTILVSIMYANNEIGTIEPIKELSKITRDHNVYFHTDAVQAFGKIPLDAKNVDMLTVSSHKLCGPKGVGALMVRKGVKIEPLLHGGGHEFGLRSSTENVAGIVGFAKAVEIAKKEMKTEAEREIKLRDMLIKGVLNIEDSHLNGHPKKRLPNNANFYFKFIEGESLILRLDMAGIEASTGSACSSTSLEASHVLLAIGLKHEEAHGSLRLTLGKDNTRQDVKYVLGVLPEVVGKLRKISPFKKSW